MSVLAAPKPLTQPSSHTCKVNNQCEKHILPANRLSALFDRLLLVTSCHLDISIPLAPSINPRVLRIVASFLKARMW